MFYLRIIKNHDYKAYKSVLLTIMIVHECCEHMSEWFCIVFDGIAYNPGTIIYVHKKKSENKYKFIWILCFFFHLFLSVSVGFMVEQFWQNR